MRELNFELGGSIPLTLHSVKLCIFCRSKYCFVCCELHSFLYANLVPDKCQIHSLYRKIPLIYPPYIPPPPRICTRKYLTQLTTQIQAPPPPIYAPLNIGPLNLSSLPNIKFTENVTLPKVFSCFLLV